MLPNLLSNFYQPSSPGQIEASAAIGLSNITSLAAVDQGAIISAGGNIDVASNGVNTNQESVTAALYASGAAGLSFGFTQTTTDIQSTVDGTLKATGRQAGVLPPINPFTQIDYGQTNSVIDFGAAANFTTGEALVYNPGAGNPIGGLTAGATYYAIALGAGRIRLATSAANALANYYITFDAYPVLTPAGATGGGLPVTQVDPTTGTIDFGFNPGLPAGSAVTYTAVAGKRISNLSNGQTYYVVAVAGIPDDIRLAATPGGAAIPLNLDPEFDGLTQSLPATLNSSTNMLSLGFATGFVPGDSFVYQGSGISGLTDGTTYWVIPNADDATGQSFRLADSQADAQTGTALPITSTTSNVTLVFDPTLTLVAGTNAFDVGFNIGLTAAFLSGPSTSPPSFPALTYRGALGTVIAGLTDGEAYFAMPDPANPRLIRLAKSAAVAAAGYADAQQSYNNFYNAIEQQAYSTYLSNNPGNIAGAQAAGTQAANAAAGQQAVVWTQMGFDAAREGTPPPAGPYTVGVSSNEITVPFTTGFQLGDSLLYVGPTAGQPSITGLAPGTDYYVAPDPNNPDAFGLADSANDALLGNTIPISLPQGVTSTTIALSTPTPPAQTVIVDSTAGTLNFGFNPMLDTGEPLVYGGTNGAPISGLTVGQTYYVIADTTNPDLIQLAASPGNALAGHALAISSTAASIGVILESQSVAQVPFPDVRPEIVIPLGQVATEPVSGTQHSFAALVGSGISITANLKTTESVQTGPLTSAGASLGESSPPPNRVGYSSFLLNPVGIIGGGLQSVYNKVTKAKAVPGANGTEPPFAFAGSFVIQTATNDVHATVGGDAVIQSGQDVHVDAGLTQTTSDSTVATISVPEGAKQSDAALAATVQLFSPTVKATVSDGAQIDAFGTIDVSATLDYPFLFPVSGTNDALGETTQVATYLANVLSGAQNFVFNDWTRTAATVQAAIASNMAVSGDGNASGIALGVAGAIFIGELTNDVEAVIGDARINQNTAPAFRGTAASPNNAQSVSVHAQITYDHLAMDGNGSLFSFSGIQGAIVGVALRSAPTS